MEVLFSCNNFNKIVNKHSMHLWKCCHTAKQSNFQNLTKGVRTSVKVKNRLYLSGDEAKYKLYRNKICSLKCKKTIFFLVLQHQLKQYEKDVERNEGWFTKS